jgi:hypothetical protein
LQRFPPLTFPNLASYNIMQFIYPQMLPPGEFTLFMMPVVYLPMNLYRLQMQALTVQPQIRNESFTPHVPQLIP